MAYLPRLAIAAGHIVSVGVSDYTNRIKYPNGVKTHYSTSLSIDALATTVTIRNTRADNSSITNLQYSIYK